MFCFSIFSPPNLFLPSTFPWNRLMGVLKMDTCQISVTPVPQHRCYSHPIAGCILYALPCVYSHPHGGMYLHAGVLWQRSLTKKSQINLLTGMFSALSLGEVLFLELKPQGEEWLKAEVSFPLQIHRVFSIILKSLLLHIIVYTVYSPTSFISFVPVEFWVHDLNLLNTL